MIEGDANFTAANGVVGGSGVWYDPYRLEGWEINASAADGIRIANTTASFIVREVRVVGCTHFCVSLTSLANGAVLDSELETIVDPDTLNEAVGVRAVDVSGFAVSSTTVTGAGYGIVIWGSSDVTIRGNHLISDPYPNSFEGILVHESRGITVRSNAIGAHRVGAFLYRSSDVNLSENRVWYGWTGFVLHTSSNVSFFGNHLDSLGTGIRAAESQDVTVLGNTLTNIHGGYPDGRPVYLNRTVGGLVYRNDFDNTGSAVDDLGPENAWDGGYPAGGNWWGIGFAPDDCSGPNQDVCPDPDGIQDAPWPIDANSTDHYPFAAPVAWVDLPPVPIFRVTPSSGDTDTVFVANASESLDLEHDWDLSYRWDWQGDGTWDTDWSSAEAANHRFPQAGDYTIRLEVRDRIGHTDNASLSVAVAQAPDRQAPAIVHTPVASALVGAFIQVNATVTDASGVANVTVFYALPGNDTYRSVRMVSLSPPAYHASLPAADGPGIVRYYIIATDSAGNQATLPAAGTYNVTVLAAPAQDNLAVYAVAAALGAAVVVTAAYVLLRRRRARPPGNP